MAAALLAAAAEDVFAQPSPPIAVTGTLTVRMEQRAERLRYHFDNDSNFEPGPLVPRAIDQEYEAPNTWLFIGAGCSAPTPARRRGSRVIARVDARRHDGLPALEHG